MSYLIPSTGSSSGRGLSPTFIIIQLSKITDGGVNFLGILLLIRGKFPLDDLR